MRQHLALAPAVPLLLTLAVLGFRHHFADPEEWRPSSPEVRGLPFLPSWQGGRAARTLHDAGRSALRLVTSAGRSELALCPGSGEIAFSPDGLPQRLHCTLTGEARTLDQLRDADPRWLHLFGRNAPGEIVITAALQERPSAGVPGVREFTLSGSATIGGWTSPLHAEARLVGVSRGRTRLVARYTPGVPTLAPGSPVESALEARLLLDLAFHDTILPPAAGANATNR